MQRTWTLLFLALMTAPAAAGELTLPQDLTWCQPRAEVLAAFEDVNELSDDMVDATGKYAGIDGFYRLIFEEEQLISLRFRFFEDAKDTARAQKALEAMLGPGQAASRGTTWDAGDGQTVAFKGQSEQMYIEFEVEMERCSSGGLSRETTAREKADLEALERKPNPAFDPYSMDDDPDAQLVENKKKKEEEKKKEEKKKKEAAMKDKDIDW